MLTTVVIFLALGVVEPEDKGEASRLPVSSPVPHAAGRAHDQGPGTRETLRKAAVVQKTAFQLRTDVLFHTRPPVKS